MKGGFLAGARIFHDEDTHLVIDVLVRDIGRRDSVVHMAVRAPAGTLFGIRGVVARLEVEFPHAGAPDVGEYPNWPLWDLVEDPNVFDFSVTQGSWEVEMIQVDVARELLARPAARLPFRGSMEPGAPPLEGG